MSVRSKNPNSGMTGNAIARAAAAFLVFAATTDVVFAQSQPTQPASSPKQTAPTLEPKALEILKASSAALAGAKTLSFTAVSTYERAARNGQPLYYSQIHEVTLQRPDKMRVVSPGDGTPDEFYYDGRKMTAYVPSSNLAAVANAPPTLDLLIDAAWDKAAIYFPFSDVIASDPYAEMSKSLKSAFYIGRSRAVGGVVTDMVAVAGNGVAAQLWIGVDDHLPRMSRVVYAREPAHARYQTEFSNWKLNPTVPAGTFASEKAAAAAQIAFAPPSGAKPPVAPSK